MTTRSFISGFVRQAPVTTALFISNILFFVLSLLIGSLDMFAPIRDSSMFGTPTPVQLTAVTGMKVNQLVANGEYWRLISSMWIHLDFLHIAFNMYALYQLGPILESLYGRGRFFLIYMYAGIAGSLASYYFTDANSAGASGALFGLCGALLMFAVKHRRRLPEGVAKSLIIGILPWVILNLALGFFGGLPVDNGAHVGGLVGGVIVTALLRLPVQGEEDPVFLKLVRQTFIAIGVALIIYAAYNWFGTSWTALQSGEAYVKFVTTH